MRKFSLKSLIAVLLVAVLLAGAGLSVFATPVGSATPTATKPVVLPTPQYLHGEAIVKAPFSENRLLVTIDGMEIALNIGENTLVVDAKTGFPGLLKNLKVGAKIVVYYGPAMTKSLPPQSFATAIVVNVEEGKARPALFVVKEIISKNDKEVRVLNTAGDLIVTITKDVAITPFKTKQIVRLSDIQVGSKLFVWYEIVALSYPGQTGAQKVVYIGQAEPNKLFINGKEIALTVNQAPGAVGLLEENGQVLVPLRTVAKALGFAIHWDSKTKMISLDDGTVKTTLTQIGRAHV